MQYNSVSQAVIQEPADNMSGGCRTIYTQIYITTLRKDHK